MNFFGIGLPEMILILVVALLVFGPKKLPEIGKSLGKALRSFQDASRDFQDEFKRQAAAFESEPPPPALPTPESSPGPVETAQIPAASNSPSVENGPVELPSPKSTSSSEEITSETTA